MAVGEHGFDPDFEWWYSEGEAPDEEWDEPAPRDVSSDEDETGNDAAVEPDVASDAAEPLTFEQAWAQAEADEAKADATATLGCLLYTSDAADD